MSTDGRSRIRVRSKQTSKAMLKSDLLTPTAMVEATGGYAELQPVAGSSPVRADPATATPDCDSACERERVAADQPSSGRSRQRRRRAAGVQ